MPNDIENNSSYFLNQRNEILAVVPQNTKKMLDVGCGEGFFANSVKNKCNAEVWGIEIVEEIAQKAEKKLDKLLIGGIEDVIDLIPNDYFDCITFNDVLEHLLHPASILAKMKKKLTTNGVIICSIPNVRSILNIYNLVIRKDWKYTNEGTLDKTHIRFFTLKSANRMFDEQNFEIIKIIGINNILKSGTIKIWFTLLNIFTLGLFSDSKYLQYLWVLKKREN
ncbi:class I SAM-dependent methyltransferase [Candidatus Lokiarchaeum ossiferum]|uniref:class I SAM-dependent methyltransferase n=1 Tax=Candidatus Lokiarchaeum ossiferum TaxID=2951803 RepID=UPI00352CAA52